MLGERLAPTPDQQQHRTEWVATRYADLLSGAESWWDGDEFVLSYPTAVPTRPTGADGMPDEIRSFWSTFNWSENPWIRDHSGNMLARSVYNRIAACTLDQLSLTRTGPTEYVLTIPRPANQLRPHSTAKLRRWATFLLLSSPGFPVGSSLSRFQAPRLRHATPVLATYVWSLISEGVIAGRPLGVTGAFTQTITLIQGTDGMHWRCGGLIPELANGSPADRQAFSQELQEHGLVFEAHPQLHRFPWAVPDPTPNRFVQAALKQQAFRYHKKVLARPLGIFLDRLEERSGRDEWQRAALSQTPQQVWDHSQGLTAYQVWTGYRVATRQLNLHHAGRLTNNNCRKQPGCPGGVETLAHLFWDCSYAVAGWTKLVGHWTGERASPQVLKHYFGACASRQVASIPTYRKALLADRFQEDQEAAERMWKQIWHILATICQTTLWADRNAAVYQALKKDITSTTTCFWATCIRQLRALATRAHRQVSSTVRGAMLYACIELLEHEPKGSPGLPGPSPDQPPDPPALTSWLRLYQRSCTVNSV